MSALVESYEFTIEDILLMHEGWITKLFVEDKKSEVEIIQLLQEKGWVVSLPQLRSCLSDWGLISPSMARSSLAPQSTLDFDGWEMGSPRSAPRDVVLQCSPSDHDGPHDLDLYTTRPLPSLPSTSPSPLSLSIDGKSNKRKNLDEEEMNGKLKVSCRPGKDTQSVGKAITDFSIGESTSQLHMFLQDQQNHERLAMGLDRVPRSFLSYRRASESTRGIQRSTQKLKKGDQDQKDKRDDDQDEKGV